MKCLHSLLGEARLLDASKLENLILDHHLDIIVVVNESYSRWIEPNAYHRLFMHHLATNFNTRFKDKTSKDLMCRATIGSKVKNLFTHMDTIGWINAETRNWLEHVPLENLALSHDGGRRYGIMITNMSEVFNVVFKGARNLPLIALDQLTFYRVNNYFTDIQEHDARHLAFGK